MLDLFKDSPEYELRKQTPFKPPTITLAQIRAEIPKHLYEKSTMKGLYYFFRTILCVCVLYYLGRLIEPTAGTALKFGVNPTTVRVTKWVAWGSYFHWQGLAFASMFCLAHEAGHGALSDISHLSNALGYILHTFLLVPYFAWRSSHHAHHKGITSLERDENFVPRTREDLKLPPPEKGHKEDHYELFQDAPLFTLLQLIVMQVLGLQLYLITNALGNPKHPPGAKHFNPYSTLFEPRERRKIFVSDVGLLAMSCILYAYAKNYGINDLIRMYFIPYMLANHWVVLLTFLHHSDPTVPYYRSSQWTFIRGALSTVDRPVLGWIGRFFFHNLSHDHIAHHINSTIPFYNQPEVTKRLKKLLGDEYNYDTTNTFRALWRSFTECQFIESEDEIAFYKNKNGVAARTLAKELETVK